MAIDADSVEHIHILARRHVLYSLGRWQEANSIERDRHSQALLDAGWEAMAITQAVVDEADRLFVEGLPPQAPSLSALAEPSPAEDAAVSAPEQQL